MPIDFQILTFVGKFRAHPSSWLAKYTLWSSLFPDLMLSIQPLIENKQLHKSIVFMKIKIHIIAVKLSAILLDLNIRMKIILTPIIKTKAKIIQQINFAVLLHIL